MKVQKKNAQGVVKQFPNSRRQLWTLMSPRMNEPSNNLTYSMNWLKILNKYMLISTF